jgi:hypothetical protein
MRADTADSLWSTARSLRHRAIEMGKPGFSGNDNDYAQFLAYMAAAARILARHKQTERITHESNPRFDAVVDESHERSQS